MIDWNIPGDQVPQQDQPHLLIRVAVAREQEVAVAVVVAVVEVVVVVGEKYFVQQPYD